MTAVASMTAPSTDTVESFTVVALEIQGNTTSCTAVHAILEASGALSVAGAEAGAGTCIFASFPSVTEAAGAVLDAYDYCGHDAALSLSAAMLGPDTDTGRLEQEVLTLLAEAEPGRILLGADVILVAAPAFAPGFDVAYRGVWRASTGGGCTRIYAARRKCPKRLRPLSSRLDWARRAVHRLEGSRAQRRDVQAVREAWQSQRGAEARLTLVCADSAAESCAFVAELALWRDSEGAVVLEGRCLRTDTTGFRSLREALGDAIRPAAIGSFTLMEALESALLSLSAAGPTILIINDAQWMDASTAMVLDYVLHSDRSGNLMVVLATVGHVPETVENLVEQLRPQQLDQLRLGGRAAVR